MGEEQGSVAPLATPSVASPSDGQVIAKPYTPGPWSVEVDSAGSWEVVLGDAYKYNPAIAHVWRGMGKFNPEANARLIAAAPEMHALLRDAWGALNFILAFYEPQNYLDTNAWKQAEAGGRRTHKALREILDRLPESGPREGGEAVRENQNDAGPPQ